jgi:type IV secretion system protein VirB9
VRCCATGGRDGGAGSALPGRRIPAHLTALRPARSSPFVKRGVVTLVLDATSILVASGLGADWSKPIRLVRTAQPVAASVRQAEERPVPPTTWLSPRQAHAFVPVRPAGRSRCAPAGSGCRSAAAPVRRAPPSPVPVAALVASRRPRRGAHRSGCRAPQPVNEPLDRRRQGVQDIVPTLVFDDGRFTYFRSPEQPVPAIFKVLPDGGRRCQRADGGRPAGGRPLSRRLMLRAGSAVVGVWNDAFDLEGVPPAGASTVPGARRIGADGGYREHQRSRLSDREPADTRSAPRAKPASWSAVRRQAPSPQRLPRSPVDRPDRGLGDLTQPALPARSDDESSVSVTAPPRPAATPTA